MDWRGWSVIVLVGCGRFGFDEGATVDRDGGVDTPIGATCTTDRDCGRCARCEANACAVEPINDLYLGHRSTCYLGVGGTRWCTGQNNDGILGLGDTVDRSLPERTADGDGWERLFIFYYSGAVGVRQGQFYKWGNTTLSPMVGGPGRDVRDLLGDLSEKCYWELDGTAAGCTGAGATVWHSLDYGGAHTCGIRESDRTLWCWGTSYSDDLGIASANDGDVVSTPTQVGAASNWVQVATGGNSVSGKGQTCALAATGKLFCFGDPAYTGTNGFNAGATPTEVTNAIDWAWVDSDWEHTCAGKNDKSVYCWGNDTYGGYVALGLTTAAVPMPVGTFDRWIMGGHHACGLAGGRWRCFGWNAQGQLGDGTTTTDGNFVDLCP